jgi:hypothetical protein
MEAKNEEHLIIKTKETRVSDEGVQSTHVEYKNRQRVDCLIKVPALRVFQKVDGKRVGRLWPRVGAIYAPIFGKKEKK